MIRIPNRVPNITHWPNLDDPIRSLKYIGSYFENNFLNEQITTFRDLFNKMRNKTLATNTRFLKRILSNIRTGNCVYPTKNLLPNNPDARLGQGYYKYCIRKVNVFAWFAIINSLKRLNFPQNKLPNEFLPKTEWCTQWNYCKHDNRQQIKNKLNRYRVFPRASGNRIPRNTEINKAINIILSPYSIRLHDSSITMAVLQLVLKYLSNMTNNQIKAIRTKRELKHNINIYKSS